MLPEKDVVETPDVEDVHADDDTSEAGHDEPNPDEDVGGEGDGDEGGRAEDDGQDDDAGADEGQEGRASEIAARRGNPEFGRLRRERREAQERADRAERELQALRGSQPRRSPQEIEAERRAKLELMGPDEKAEFLANEVRAEYRTELQQLRFEQADSRDAARFDALCARNPVFADLADEVERELTNLRRNGGNSSREVVAKYILGDRAVKRASQGGKKKQAEEGRRRIQRQTAKPGQGGSDRAGGDERRGGDERAKRAKRLDGLNI